MQAIALGSWRERIEAQDAPSLRLRIYQVLRQAVAEGDLRPAEMLPSSREAAAALGISRNTVNGAYDLLRAEGILDIKRGRRPRIRPVPLSTASERHGDPSPVAGAVTSEPLSKRGNALACDHRVRARAGGSGPFSPGEPDPALFPSDAWGRALRRAARRDYGALAGYRDPHGLPGLRLALADQLERHRGVRVAPDHILILPTVQAGLNLAAATLADPGDSALVEDPGYAGARAALSGAGLRLTALPVDDDGADIAKLTVACEVEDARGGAAGEKTAVATAPRLIYVTPSTQYPTGARMALHRRLALLAFARSNGAFILEDDYDSEFVWRGGEIAALQALDDNDRVIGLGTVAKSLLPGLRLAWMIVPERLVGAMRLAQRNLGLLANLHGQAALQDFLESGAYRAHLRRITRAYAERAQLLVDALERVFAGRVRITRPDGGLQICVPLAEGVSEGVMVDVLQQRGFAVAGLSGYALANGREGLVIGFAQADAARAAALCAAIEAGLARC